MFLQTNSNFWRRDGLSGFAYTDLPLERLWAFDRDDGPSLLIAYSEAMGALRLDAMTRPDVLTRFSRMPERSSPNSQKSSKEESRIAGAMTPGSEARGPNIT